MTKCDQIWPNWPPVTWSHVIWVNPIDPRASPWFWSKLNFFPITLWLLNEINGPKIVLLEAWQIKSWMAISRVHLELFDTKVERLETLFLFLVALNGQKHSPFKVNVHRSTPSKDKLLTAKRTLWKTPLKLNIDNFIKKFITIWQRIYTAIKIGDLLLPYVSIKLYLSWTWFFIISDIFW